MTARAARAALTVVLATLGACASAPPPATPAVRIVEAFLDAFNAQDAAAMAALCDEQVRWMSINGDVLGVETSGRDALETAMQGYFAGLPSARSTLLAVEASGSFVTTLERAEWQTRAGRSAAQCSAATYEIRDQLVANVWYFAAHECE